MKKTWETPKLIALVRNNPQEAVLSLCKGNPTGMAAGVAPASSWDSCRAQTLAAMVIPCTNCSTVSVS